MEGPPDDRMSSPRGSHKHGNPMTDPMTPKARPTNRLTVRHTVRNTMRGQVSMRSMRSMRTKSTSGTTRTPTTRFSRASRIKGTSVEAHCQAFLRHAKEFSCIFDGPAELDEGQLMKIWDGTAVLPVEERVEEAIGNFLALGIPAMEGDDEGVYFADFMPAPGEAGAPLTMQAMVTDPEALLAEGREEEGHFQAFVQHAMDFSELFGGPTALSEERLRELWAASAGSPLDERVEMCVAEFLKRGIPKTEDSGEAFFVEFRLSGQSSELQAVP